MARVLIVARQNETIRRYAGEEIDLATMDLSNCFAVVITNSRGDASLTHVDAKTDLRFIDEEFKKFSPGAEITYIYSADNSTIPYELMMNVRPELTPKNADGIGQLATNTRCVIVLPNNKFQFPIKAQLELATEGIYTDEQKEFLRQNKENIPLLQGKYKEFQGVTSDFGPEFTLRDRIAQIECTLGGILEIKRHRVVVYDRGYLINSDNIQMAPNLLGQLDQIKNDYEAAVPVDKRNLSQLNAFLAEKYLQYAADEFSTKIIKEELGVSLTAYWDYKSISVSRKHSAAMPATKMVHRSSPITAAGNAHDELVSKINILVKDKPNAYKAFTDAVNQKHYGKALRTACNNIDTHEKSFELIKILLGYKGKLSIYINEQAGKDNYAAIHYAALKNHKALYEFLIEQGAEPELKANNGTSAAQLLTMLPSNEIKLQ